MQTTASSRSKRLAITPYLYLLPAFVVIVAFQILPIFYSLFVSFFEWDIIRARRFVGLGNYLNLFHDVEFWQALFNTTMFAAGSVVFGLAISLFIAVLLSRKIAGLNCYRMAYFIPYVTAMTAVAIVWKWLFNPQFGLLNYLLSLVGLPGTRWLQDPFWARVAVIIFVIWKTMGFNILIFLTRLLDIDKSFYEAAEIDGAGPWRIFRYITWPLLGPTTLFLLIISTIFSFQMFVPVYIMTPDGGPANSCSTMVFFLYENAYVDFRMGYACSIAYVLFFIILALTLIQRKALGRKLSGL